jgi:hypothetical protein
VVIHVGDSNWESRSHFDSRNRKIQRLGGQAEPTEVGVLRQVVSELTIIVFCKQGRQKESCDLNSMWNRFKQCHQEDVKRDLCPIQLWKGK